MISDLFKIGKENRRKNYLENSSGHDKVSGAESRKLSQENSSRHYFLQIKIIKWEDRREEGTIHHSLVINW